MFIGIIFLKINDNFNSKWKITSLCHDVFKESSVSGIFSVEHEIRFNSTNICLDYSCSKKNFLLNLIILHLSEIIS